MFFSGSVFAGEIFTHAPEYPPSEDAVIEGTYWANEKVTLQVTHLDGTLLTGPGGDPWEADATYDESNAAPVKESGGFLTYWNVDWAYAGDTLMITAEGNESGTTATASFVSPKTSLNQLHNGTFTSNAAWANGNINSNNSCYSEGRSVAYRYFIKELDAGTEHFFTIQMEWTKGGIHALDYLTDYDATETDALFDVGGACGTMSTSPPPGCNDPTESFTFPDFLNTANYSGTIPPDFFTTVNPGFVLDGPRNLKAYNVIIDSIGDYAFGGTSSDRKLEMVVYFTVRTTSSVGFFWGGHLAESSADAWGAGYGSSAVGGAPYHMRAKSLDGGGGCNQDRSIQNGVICMPPNTGITMDFSTVCDVGNNMYIATDTASTANMWTWTITNGTIVGPDDQSSVSFTVNPGLGAGDFVTIMVESCDGTSGCPGESCCATDSKSIPVAVCNQPPVASCPDNESHSFLCTPSEICVGPFSASDPDNNIVSETVDFGVLNGGNVCFTPNAAGVYIITYTVTDAYGATDECQTEVTVSYVNQPPVCNIPGDASYLVCGDTTFNIPVSATDPDGNLTGCTKTSGPGTYDGSTWIFTTTAPGVYTATFECSDDCGEICGGTVNITVGYNSAPVCNIPSSGTYFVCSDTTFSFPVSANDVDGNLVSCIQKSGNGTFDGTNWTFTTTGPGAYSATFECTDECGEVCTGSVNINVNYNHNPVCNMPPHNSYFVCGDTTFNIPISATDVDGNLVGCTKLSGPGTFNGSTWTFTSSGDGTYIATFECTDECGSSCTGEAKVTVTNNKAPTPQCPDNQTIFVCDLSPITINGFICEDPNGNLATCEVDVGELVGDAVTFTPIEGPNVITITATDDCGAVGTCYTTVTVVLNGPPVASCPGNESHSFLCEPSEICVSGFSSSDPDNNIVEELVSLGTLTDGTVCFTPDAPGVYTIIYTVTDACGETDECQTQVTVTFDNNPPVCNIPGDASYFVCGDTTFNFSVSATDPDGNLTGCTKISGPGSYDGSTWTFTTTAPGVYTATFECSDDCGLTCGGTVNITVGYNSAPVCNIPDDASYFVCGDTTFNIPVSATDVDGNLVGCTKTSGPGSFDGSTWTFTTTAPGVYTATFECSDECGEVCGGTVNITVGYNSAPVCELPTPEKCDYYICQDTTFNIEISATDVDDNLVGCTKTSGPGSFDGSIWTFDVTASGTFTATFECVDECGEICGGTVVITVAKNQPPVASCPGNESHSFLCEPSEICVSGFSSADPDNNIVEESVSLGTLTDGTVCFTPDAPGVYTIIYTVTDACGKTDECQTQVTVSFDNNSPVCDLPSNGTYFVCADTTFNFSVSATDPDDNLVGCEMTSGSGILNGGIWTFTTTGPGVYSATFECSDDCGLTCGGTVEITVNYNQAPVVSCPGNETFQFACEPGEICVGPFSATDADNNTVDEVVDLGTLTDGTVCFTPTSAGVYTITYTVTDACGTTSECQTEVTVELGNQPPVCDLPANTTYFICGDSTFNFEISATDPDDNLAGCEMTSGDGSFDGTTWTFTATTAGQYSATFECTDECGLTCGGMVTMTIQMNNPPPCDLPQSASYFVCDDTTFSFPVSATDPDGNLVGCEKTSGVGTLIDGIWSFTTTGPGTYSASFECSDACGETCGGSVDITVTYNNDPVATVPNPMTMNVCTLSELVIGGFSCSDPDGNLARCETDVGTYSNGEVRFTPVAGANVITLFAVDECGMVDSAKTTVTINLNHTPTCDIINHEYFQCVPSQVCEPKVATDPDGDITIGEIILGPGVFENGQWCYTPEGSETVEVTIRFTDMCGAYCDGTFTAEFNINDGPVASCPGNQTKYLFSLGEICVDGLECSDPDDNLTSCQILVNGASETLVDGTVCFDPVWGDNIIELTATDACGQSATCQTVITVEELYECPIVKIEKTHNTLQGHYTNVEVTIENGNFDLAGFDLLLSYDASALSFINAEAGDLLQYCGWEHFSYRFGSRGNCGGSCPSGLLRIIGLAETNNGSLHPDCFGAPTGDPWQLAVLTFFVSNDRTFNCMYAPIKFFWDDCGDNALSNITGDSLIIGGRIYDFEGNLIWDELDDINYPENDRIPFTGTPDLCGNEGKYPPIRCVDYVYGGIDIVCSDSIDDRGDVNMNGLPNEVADAVMLTNYFIGGLTAFGNHSEASIAASDVNADGVSLTVADLVYLVRIITGDTSPILKPILRSEFNITSHMREDRIDIKYDSETKAGAALLIFETLGNAGIPILGEGAENMDMTYGVEGNQLRVLIYNIGSQSISSGVNTLLSIPAEGSITLIDAEIADYFGGMMTTNLKTIPDNFRLSQNYPNPFNPSTSISLSMAVPGNWSIAVYNIAGQKIREYSGYSEAGIVSVTWDGSDESGRKVASGIYLYKAVSGDFNATRKMVLMK
ncbi:MAG: T9SS type A sorting domain-containing protein [Candidatus Zixiibacteriota bacterium]